MLEFLLSSPELGCAFSKASVNCCHNELSLLCTLKFEQFIKKGNIKRYVVDRTTQGMPYGTRDHMYVAMIAAAKTFFGSISCLLPWSNKNAFT